MKNFWNKIDYCNDVDDSITMSQQKKIHDENGIVNHHCDGLKKPQQKYQGGELHQNQYDGVRE